MEPIDWEAKLAPGPDDDAAKQFQAGWDAAMRDRELSEVETDARLARVETKQDRIETKQDALYAEIHAVRLEFAKLVEGVMGAMTSNPLLRRLLGGGK